jgi:Response regulator containing CheY-like receiver, AAA-type ATPase, and DNA-binding domains
MTSILVVDDEHSVAEFIKEVLTEEGYLVEMAHSGREALSIVKKFSPDIVILDFMMPDMNGLQVLAELKAFDESIQVLMLTAYNSVPTAIEAIRQGAADYILKPFDLEAFKLSVAKLVEKIALKHQVRYLQETFAKRAIKSEFVLCPSPQMSKVYELASQVAQTNNTTVLILGESGVGKEHVAQFIHLQSVRKSKPFVELNCAAIPDNLLESELFGHEPGAFTDARSKKIGLLEYADGGTLFLDEIADMPLTMQAKVLKVMETKSFRRIGGLKELKTDVRIVAATNRDLALAIEKGQFREDLYYRLQVLPIVIPPLRERPEDITHLASFFLNIFSQAMRKRLTLSDSALKALLSYKWKGNVRELKNVVERAAIITPSDGIIQPEHLGLAVDVETPTVSAPPFAHALSPVNEAHADAVPAVKFPDNFSLKAYLERIEREHILAALAQTRGNQLRAAKLLGIERHVLRYQMKRLGIEAKSDVQN